MTRVSSLIINNNQGVVFDPWIISKLLDKKASFSGLYWHQSGRGAPKVGDVNGGFDGAESSQLTNQLAVSCRSLGKSIGGVSPKAAGSPGRQLAGTTALRICGLLAGLGKH